MQLDPATDHSSCTLAISATLLAPFKWGCFAVFIMHDIVYVLLEIQLSSENTAQTRPNLPLTATRGGYILRECIELLKEERFSQNEH
eukprot:scaffold286121_cov15-Prasinocladus_malaysianus.AAC.1